MTFSEFFQQGGPVILVILLGSVVALAIFLERLYYLRESVHVPKETIQKLKNLNPSSVSQTVDYLRATPKPLHDLLLRLIDMRQMPSLEVSEYLQPYMARTREKFSRGVDVLSTIASISPLLGLLGTVLGMMHVFQSISSNGLGNTGALAGGISEALLTTLVGLMVAIPSFVAYKFINARADSILRKMEVQINSTFEKFYESGPKKSS